MNKDKKTKVPRTTRHQLFLVATAEDAETDEKPKTCSQSGAVLSRFADELDAEVARLLAL